MKIQKLISFLKKRYLRTGGAVPRVSENPFQVLVSCILSQRTREENTELAARQLFARARTPEQMLALPLPKLRNLIKPAGFYRQKARRIKQICKILLQRYKGKVPRTFPELLALPGVGDKTAAVVLCYGYSIPCVPVDTHVAKISKRLGLVPERAKPAEIRKILESLIPVKDQIFINLALVNFGREICLTKKPKCELCPFTKDCLYFKKCEDEISSYRRHLFN